MIKVCHMTSAHNSQDVRILKKQCTSLAKKYETFLVSKGETYTENNVQVVGIGEVTGGRLRRMTKVSKLIYRKALELNCDVYQIHDPELIPYALKLKKQGKKVIFDSHENYALQISEKRYIPKIFRGLCSSIFSHYQNRAMRKLDGVIFPCLKDGKHIFDNKCKNIATVGNEPKLEELYDKFNSNEAKEPQSICHVGSLVYERGIEHLIKAGAKTKSKVILAGNYAPPQFKEELSKLEEYKCVDYRGYCNREEVREIYEKSIIGNCTLLNIGQYNYYDNFATKIYEYMSMGLPVIMSDYKFARKVNEEYNFAILVDPQNIEEIANAIEYIFDNPQVAREMGENGRKAIKERFNWNIEEEKLFKLYEEVLG